MQIPTDISWGAIAAGGALLPTLVFWLTQFTKEEIDKRWHIPTRFIAWFYAFLLSNLALACTGVTDWRLYVATPISSVLAAVIAIGMHQEGRDDGIFNEPG